MGICSQARRVRVRQQIEIASTSSRQLMSVQPRLEMTTCAAVDRDCTFFNVTLTLAEAAMEEHLRTAGLCRKHPIEDGPDPVRCPTDGGRGRRYRVDSASQVTRHRGVCEHLPMRAWHVEGKGRASVAASSCSRPAGTTPSLPHLTSALLKHPALMEVDALRWSDDGARKIMASRGVSR